MMQIRKRLVDGDSHTTVQQELQMNKRTYFRYVKRIFEDDRKALQEKNQEELQRQLVILSDRYNFIYQELRSIATDTTQSAEDRMSALHSMASLALTISRLSADAPTITAVQLRKLEAVRTGALYFGDLRAHLPPIWQPEQLPFTTSNYPPEQEGERERERENGDARDNDEEEQERRDW